MKWFVIQSGKSDFVLRCCAKLDTKRCHQCPNMDQRSFAYFVVNLLIWKNIRQRIFICSCKDEMFFLQIAICLLLYEFFFFFKKRISIVCICDSCTRMTWFHGFGGVVGLQCTCVTVKEGPLPPPTHLQLWDCEVWAEVSEYPNTVTSIAQRLVFLFKWTQNWPKNLAIVTSIFVPTSRGGNN